MLLARRMREGGRDGLKDTKKKKSRDPSVDMDEMSPPEYTDTHTLKSFHYLTVPSPASRLIQTFSPTYPALNQRLVYHLSSDRHGA